MAGPEKGPNGEDTEAAVRQRAQLAQAVDSALSVGSKPLAAEQQFPVVAFFAARERPKLHKSQPSVYEVLFGLRLSPIHGAEGQGVGFAFGQGIPARQLVTMLRAAADRAELVCECVEKGEPVPAMTPANPCSSPDSAVDNSPVDNSAEGSTPAKSDPGGSPGGGSLGGPLG